MRFSYFHFYRMDYISIYRSHCHAISPRIKFVRHSKRQIFIEMFQPNLQGPVWSRHIGVPFGVPFWYTNMAAGK